jgi:hypothetical protein
VEARNNSLAVDNTRAENNRRAVVHSTGARRWLALARSRPPRHRRRRRQQPQMARPAGPDRSATPIHCSSTAPMPQTSAGRSRSRLKGPRR